jgi:5-methylcytosine-specific restriction endonuclease McrA
MGRKKKARIPKALRDQVWLQHAGKVYETKCLIEWCQNTITVTNFHCGHNIPESKGGATTLENLTPICASCNLSMGNTYSIDDWNRFGRKKAVHWWCCTSVDTVVVPGLPRR